MLGANQVRGTLTGQQRTSIGSGRGGRTTDQFSAGDESGGNGGGGRLHLSGRGGERRGRILGRRRGGRFEERRHGHLLEECVELAQRQRIVERFERTYGRYATEAF